MQPRVNPIRIPATKALLRFFISFTLLFNNSLLINIRELLAKFDNGSKRLNVN